VHSSLSLTVDCGHSLQLVTCFRYLHGRYRHQVELRDTDGALLDHWEDDFDSREENWPSAPPIQQLSRETVQGRDVLLGVGQAGAAHWSISVETIEHDDGGSLKFDLACRCRTLPTWLGSTYRSLSSDTSDGPRLSIASSVPRGNSASALCIPCELSAGDTRKYPTTFQWTYQITYEKNPPSRKLP
jgi:hypothetical protein